MDIRKSRKNLFRKIVVLLMIVSLFSPITSFAASDVKPPTLNELTVSTKEATVGDTVKVEADVTDDLSGVSSVSILYQAPVSTNSKYVNLYLNSETGKYEGTFQIGQYDASGNWEIDYIALYDNQNNYYFYHNSNGGYEYKYENYEYKDLSQYNVVVSGTEEDSEPPTLTSLTVSPKEVSEGDTVKVEAEVTDNLTGVSSVSIRYQAPVSTSSKYVSLYLNSETGKYEGTFQIGQNDASGNWKIDYIALYDNQNNYYFYHNSNGGYEYKYDNYEYKDLSQYDVVVSGTQEDKKPPVLESFTVSPKNVSVGDTVKVEAEVTDDLSGVSSVSIRYQAPVSTNSKYVSLYFNSETGKYEGTFQIGQYDATGNWRIDYIALYDNQNNYYFYHNSNGGYEYKYENYEYKNLSEYDVIVGESDQEAPITNINIESSTPKNGEWYTSNLNVSFDSTDNNEVDKTLYRINNGNWIQYTDSFEIQEEGSTTIEFKSVDKVGNEEEIKSEVLKIDKTKPVTTLSEVPKNWTNGDVTISLTGSDEISGIEHTEYKINGSEWTKYEGPIVVSQDGVNKIEYRSFDNAGNAEESKSVEVKLDKTSPVTSSSEVKDGWYNSDVQMTLDSTDSLSGVLKTQYRVNGGEWLDYSEKILLTNEGVNKVEYRSIDNAGNIEEVKGVEVKIDKTMPTLNISFDTSVITDKNHKLIPIKAFVIAKDEPSGIESYELVSIESNQLDNDSGDGNTDQDIQEFEIGANDTEFLLRAETTKNEDRVYTITYKAVDKAGNSVTASENVVVKANNSKK